VATLVVLLEADEGEVTLGSRAVGHLARLGVTSVAVFGDERTLCIALEGWAFDAAGSANEVVSAISVATRSVQVLRPVMHTAMEAFPANR